MHRNNHHNPHADIQHKNKINERRKRRDEILNMCREVCEKHKGLAQIDERYVVVDLDRYSIRSKEVNDG